MIACERGGKRRPHVACIGKTVQQHHGGSASANPDVNRRAVGSNLLNAEIARIGLDACCCGQRIQREQEEGKRAERFERHGPLRECQLYTDRYKKLAGSAGGCQRNCVPISLKWSTRM